MIKSFEFHIELFKSTQSDMQLLLMFRLGKHYVPTNVQYSPSYTIVTALYVTWIHSSILGASEAHVGKIGILQHYTHWFHI
jgi:hypothetical protein